MSAIYTVFTSPHHAPMPNHLPTLIVTPHGQPSQILYTYLHTEENRVNYLLTPSAQGDLCVAKLFPPPRLNNPNSTASVPTVKTNVVRCEASRDLRWTIENTGVMSPIYKIVNQDETPLYQISKPNPNAEFWTMFYFKYAGHQIPPKRIEFGKVAKNPQEKGGGTRISITGKSEDEKQVWQTLGVGNEDCVEWVVCCACLNLLDDQILQAAEKKNGGASGVASTSAAGNAGGGRPNLAPLQRVAPASGPASSSRSPLGPGIASTSPAISPASNLAQAYRNNPPPLRGGPPSGPGSYRSDPRGVPIRGSSGTAQSPQQHQQQLQQGIRPVAPGGGGFPGSRSAPGGGLPTMGQGQGQPQQMRNGARPPPAGSGRRF